LFIEIVSKMGFIRDFQKSKVYSSEDVLSSSENNKKPLTIEQINVYLKKITRSQWFITRFGRKKITASEPTNSDREALCHCEEEGANLVFPEWACCTLIVLHELAHAVLPTHQIPDHGAEFCGVLLELVKKYMSKEDAILLVTEFQEKKIKYLSLEEALRTVKK
jgi:putative metallohydrolase (TIGR04338 family)